MHTINIRHTLMQIIYKFIIRRDKLITHKHLLFTLKVRDIDNLIVR